MNFTYKVLHGKEIKKGKISAKNYQEALTNLKSQGYRPISLEEDIEKNKGISLNIKFKNRDYYFLFTQLALILKSGIVLEEALKIVADNFNEKKRNILLKISQDLHSGISLSQAMAQSKKFTDFILSLVDVGENSSNLEQVFRKLASFYKREEKLRKNIYSTLTYPIILIIVSALVVNFLMLNVIPTFADIYDQAGESLPLMTRLLIGFSKILRENFIIISFIFLAISFFFIIYLKKNPKIKDKILLKSAYYKRIYTLRFSFTIYTILSAGLTIDEATQTLCKMEANILIKKELGKVSVNLKKGRAYWQSLRDMNIFPKIFISMVRVGEETSSFKEIFKNFIDCYEEETENYNKRFLELLGPILIIILSIIIGFIVLSIALPIFNMVNAI